MIFLFWLLVVVAYLFATAFLFSALFAWRDRAMDRKTEEKRLREYAALAILARYHHRRACDCHVTERGLVRLDGDCLKWTRVAARLESARRELARTGLRKAAQKKDEPGVTRARHLASLN